MFVEHQKPGHIIKGEATKREMKRLRDNFDGQIDEGIDIYATVGGEEWVRRHYTDGDRLESGWHPWEKLKDEAATLKII